MHEFFPFIFVGAVIGAFALVFILAYAALRRQKESLGFDRHMPDGEIIRRLLKYAKPHGKAFLLVFFLMLFSIVYDLASPLIVGNIEGTIKDGVDLKYLFTMVAVYAGILVVSMVCTYFQALVLQKTGQKIISQLRMDTFTHIESLSHEQLNNMPVGKLVTRVTNDSNAISFMFTNILVTMLKNCMVIVGVLGLCWS